jgi:hypothetical protein
MFDVPHNSDKLTFHRARSITKIDPLSDRVLSLPELLRHPFIDDRYLRSIRIIAIPTMNFSLRLFPSKSFVGANQKKAALEALLLISRNNAFNVSAVFPCGSCPVSNS